jgi:hypothetical protein
MVKPMIAFGVATTSAAAEAALRREAVSTAPSSAKLIEDLETRIAAIEARADAADEDRRLGEARADAAMSTVARRAIAAQQRRERTPKVPGRRCWISRLRAHAPVPTH